MSTEFDQEFTTEKRDFWKDFVSMTDYFSHAILPMQQQYGVKSEDLFYSLGRLIGAKAAKTYANLSIEETLHELQHVWREKEIGRIEIESNSPLRLSIHDCTICGQLPGTGGMFDCAFHEGFFGGVLSFKENRNVKIQKVTNFEGGAGTWCRSYIADLSLR
jgi:predicted hydrocarbon binding protein